MKTRILRASPVVVLAACCLVAGCDRIGQPSEAEAGAAKIARVAAEARAITSRLAATPESISTSLVVDGTTREIDKPLIGLATAADELRSLAGKVQSAGATAVQRREAGVLAGRLRREATVLDLMALDRMYTRMQALTDSIEAELLEARAIAASASPQTLAAAQARVKATKAVLAQYRDQAAEQKVLLGTEETKLSKVNSVARTASERADAVDAEAQVLRSEAATSAPSVARPKVDAAVAKMNEARVLRREAAEQEIGASVLRGEVQLARAQAVSTEEAQTWLASRLSATETAATAMGARAETAARTVSELQAAAGKEMEELKTLATAEFQPLWLKVKEALDGNPATKTPTDGAVVGIAKARLYQLAMGALDQTAALAVAQGAPSEITAQLQAGRAAFTEQAKAALLEARDSLGGSASPGGEALLATLQQIADALGIDMTTAAAVPAPAAEPAGDEPMAEEPTADAPAEPAADAPAAPAADEPAADEPGSDTPNK
jgi:hypothetical protein